MHEFSICQSIVNTVIAEMENRKHRPQCLLKTHIAIGELRQLVPEYLKFGYETLTKNTIAEGSTLEIKSVPITGKCKDCNKKGDLSKDCFLCKYCGSSHIEIIGGKELYIESIEVDE